MNDRAIDPQVLVGVIGAGAMGGGIAQLAAQAGHQVLIVDAQAGAAERAVANAADTLKTLAAKGKV
ncbi:MAG: 3-hydroxyacyl-CoA dehydrogenase NAD-binding domain-containing protein, partial [Burkholderiaceae bacterium]